eukprot:scaffold2697_cov392-Prasinococcus_capsulatus_cf.AAC.8
MAYMCLSRPGWMITTTPRSGRAPPRCGHQAAARQALATVESCGVDGTTTRISAALSPAVALAGSSAAPPKMLSTINPWPVTASCPAARSDLQLRAHTAMHSEQSHGGA